MNLLRIACLLGALFSLLACGPGGSESPPSDQSTVAESTEAGAEDDLIPGRWRPLRPRPTEREELTPEQREAIERLESVGYVAGSQKPRTDRQVTIHDPGRTHAGLNLFTSGHAAAAYLIEMNGELVHQWHRPFADIFPYVDIDPENANYDFWRRALLLPGGDLVVIFEGIGLVRIDRDSQIVWAHLNQAHHDLELLPSGDILTLTREAKLVPRVHETEPILEDFFTVVGQDGHEKENISVLECFERSEFAELGLRRAGTGGDLFHTNTVTVLGDEATGIVPWLRPGYVLTSLRTPSVLAVVDLAGCRVVKAWAGDFDRQHDPKLVEGGRILLFDNTGLERQSRVIELEPSDLSIVWEYRGDPDLPLASFTCGTVERLPNGNTLITESDHGRALEISADGDVVWEYYSPFRIGGDPEYIASLFEMERLPLGRPEWLD